MRSTEGGVRAWRVDLLRVKGREIECDESMALVEVRGVREGGVSR